MGVPAVWAALLMLFLVGLDAGDALPSKGMVVFASKRSGQWRIWRMDVNGRNPVQVSSSAHEAIMPTISPDGQWIMYKEGNDTRQATDLWIVRNDGSEELEVVQGSDRTGLPVAPAWGTNGFYYQKGRKIYLFEPASRTSTQKHDLEAFSEVSTRAVNVHAISHDGRYILARSDRYRGGFTGGNGTYDSFYSAIALDVLDASTVYFLGPGCEPTAPPTGDYFFHVRSAEESESGGPDIMRIHRRDIRSRSSYAVEVGYDDADMGHEYWPRVSNDNRWLIYGATPGCHEYHACSYGIFIHQLGASGHRARISTGSDFVNWPHLWVGDVPAPTPQPGIHLLPADLVFSAPSGGGRPVERRVTVSALGGQSLAGLTASASSPWLAVSVTGSGDAVTLVNRVAVAGLEAGVHRATVTVRVDGITLTYPVALRIVDPRGVHIRMNAGDNVVRGWEPDDPYVTGGEDFAKNTAFDLSGGDNPGPHELYQSVRHLDPAFTFPHVPDGEYRVRLHFVDPAYDATAKSSARAMNVAIEGRVVLRGYDVVAAARGGHRVVIEEFRLRVSDGNGLTVEFDRGEGNDAFVAAIEVISADPG